MPEVKYLLTKFQFDPRSSSPSFCKPYILIPTEIHIRRQPIISYFSDQTYTIFSIPRRRIVPIWWSTRLSNLYLSNCDTLCMKIFSKTSFNFTYYVFRSLVLNKYHEFYRSFIHLQYNFRKLEPLISSDALKRILAFESIDPWSSRSFKSQINKLPLTSIQTSTVVAQIKIWNYNPFISCQYVCLLRNS